MGSHSECNTTFIERSKVPKNDDLKSQIEYSRYRCTVYMICGISVNGWINIANINISGVKSGATLLNIYSLLFFLLTISHFLLLLPVRYCHAKVHTALPQLRPINYV